MVMAAWFSDKDNADTWQRGSRTRIGRLPLRNVIIDVRRFETCSVNYIGGGADGASKAGLKWRDNVPL